MITQSKLQEQSLRLMQILDEHDGSINLEQWAKEYEARYREEIPMEAFEYLQNENPELGLVFINQRTGTKFQLDMNAPSIDADNSLDEMLNSILNGR